MLLLSPFLLLTHFSVKCIYVVNFLIVCCVFRQDEAGCILSSHLIFFLSVIQIIYVHWHVYMTCDFITLYKTYRN